jgi:hypothetical protein
MIWAAAGCGYAALHVTVVLLLHGRPDALPWIGHTRAGRIFEPF